MKRNHADFVFKGVQKILKHDDKLEFHLTYDKQDVIVETALTDEEFKVLRTSIDNWLYR